MATYVVTNSNWNSAAFWSGISAVNGDTLDFANLPNGFSVQFDNAGTLQISDGVTVFRVGEPGDIGADASISSGSISDFDVINTPAGSGANDITTDDDAQTINAAGGDDSISSNGGNDTIAGGSGNDTMEGGDDADTFIIEDGFGNDSIVGGEGTTGPGDSDSDVIDLSAVSGPVTVTYTGDEAGTITDGTDTISFSEIEQLILTDQDDVVDGYLSTPDAETLGFDIFGADGDDSIQGTREQDTIRGGNDDDTIDGMAGADSIEGGAGRDDLGGGEGDDTLRGGISGDRLGGWLGDDSLFGDAGTDTLLGGEGNDYIDGGDDDDTFIVMDNFGTDTIVGGEGGADDDTLDLSQVTGPVTVTYTGDEAGTITDGTDTITFSEIEHLILTEQSDQVDARNAPGGVSIDTGDGNDSIEDGSGDDSIIAGAGNDSVEANDGNDTIEGGVGSDSLEGGDGSDSILGGDGNDFLAGYDVQGLAGRNISAPNRDDNAADTIDGGAGQDTILGGGGADLLSGGADEDRFIVHDGFGNDTITGGETGLDDDTIDLSEMTDPVTVTYTGDEAGTITDGTDTVTYSEIETLILTDQADVVDASADGVGIDIDAGDGADTITGGTGDDSISGGGGDDVFNYSLGDGHDTITDFNTGNTGTLDDGDSTNNDFIDLSGFYDHIAELHADQADDGILNQSNTTDTRGQSVDYSDNSQFGAGEGLTFTGASADGSSFTQENTGVVCFAQGTLIDTPLAPVPVEKLRPGDLVNTRNGGAQTLQWVGRTDLTLTAGTRDPRRTPVRFKPLKSSGRALFVSPQHCVLMRLPNGKEVFARARHLAEETRLASFACGRAEVSYFHLCFSSHSVVISEGIPSESFYPGLWAMRMISIQSGAPLLRQLPELARNRALEAYGPRVAPVLSRAQVRALAKANNLSFAPASIDAKEHDSIG